MIGASAIGEAPIGALSASGGGSGSGDLVLSAADCTQANSSSTGAVLFAGGGFALAAANCIQANACTGGAVAFAAAAPLMLAAADCVQANACTGGAVMLQSLGAGLYCSQAGLAARFGEIELVQLSNPDDPTATNINELRVDDAVADIDALITAKLQARYAVPLSSVPRVLRNIACDLVRARMYEDRIPDRVAERERAALKLLDEIAAGRVLLGLDELSQATPSIDGPQWTTGSSSRVFSPTSLSDYAP